MALNKFGIVAMSLIVSNSVFAAVTITAPEEIVLIAVNDQEVSGGLIRTAKNVYKVDAGNVSFSVRYQQFFKHLDGEHDIAKSGVVTILAPNLIDGENYKIVPVNVPNNYDDAKRYAEQPTIALFDKNNKLVVQQTGANNDAKPWLGSGVFGRTFDFTKSNKAPAQQPAAVYGASAGTTQSLTMSSNVVAPVTNNNTVVVSGNTADQQLIQIWKSASKAERQRFMSWLAEQ